MATRTGEQISDESTSGKWNSRRGGRLRAARSAARIRRATSLPDLVTAALGWTRPTPSFLRGVHQWSGDLPLHLDEGCCEDSAPVLRRRTSIAEAETLALPGLWRSSSPERRAANSISTSYGPFLGTANSPRASKHDHRSRCGLSAEENWCPLRTFRGRKLSLHCRRP